MDLLPVLADALQAQLNFERLNAATYRAMAHALENVNWSGTAAHFMNAATDEQSHADKIAAYLIDRNTAPRYDELPAPEIPPADILSMMRAALERERATTVAIHALYLLTFEQADPATTIFLQWFVTEQVESEREYYDKILEVQRAQGDAAALLVLDREYGK